MISADAPVCPAAEIVKSDLTEPVPCPIKGASLQNRSDLRQNSIRNPAEVGAFEASYL